MRHMKTTRKMILRKMVAHGLTLGNDISRFLDALFRLATEKSALEATLRTNDWQITVIIAKNRAPAVSLHTKCASISAEDHCSSSSQCQDWILCAFR